MGRLAAATAKAAITGDAAAVVGEFSGGLDLAEQAGREVENRLRGSNETDRETDAEREELEAETRKKGMRQWARRNDRTQKNADKFLDKNQEHVQDRTERFQALQKAEETFAQEQAVAQQEIRFMERQADAELEQAQAAKVVDRKRAQADVASVEAENDREIEEIRFNNEFQLRKRSADAEAEVTMKIAKLITTKRKKLSQNLGNALETLLKDRIKETEKSTAEAIKVELEQDDKEQHQAIQIRTETKRRRTETQKTTHDNEGDFHKANIDHAKYKNASRIKQQNKKWQKEQELEWALFDYELLCQETEASNKKQSLSIQKSNDLKKQRAQQFEDTKLALGLDSQTMRAQNGMALRSNLAKLFFLAIVLACEIDTFGFVMAAQHYGKIALDNSDYIILGSLITGLASYSLAILAYGCHLRKYKDEFKERGEEGTSLPDIEKLIEEPKHFNDLDFHVVSEPFELKMYHWLPLYRSFILIKEVAPDDVEALFRINALSTFTLGFNQLFCLVLTYFHQYESEGDFMQYVIYTNQLFNFLVSMIYFSTSLASKMKGVTKVAAMKYNLRERMQRDLLRYNDAMDQDAIFVGEKLAKGESATDEDSTRTVKIFHRMIERQIQELAGAKEIDLTPFSIEDKNELLRKLRIKQINAFDSVTSV